MKNIILFLICLISCTSNNKGIFGTNDFHPDSLKEAWIKSDTLIIDRWIYSLSDTSIEDGEFYGRLAVLSNVTSFVYGNADPSEKSFWEVPKDKRALRKANIAKVYQAYRQSCLFLKPTTWDKSLTIQDRFWNDTMELNPEDMSLLSEAIDSLCNE